MGHQTEEPVQEKREAAGQETHLCDSQRQDWGNWPTESKWPVGDEILWDGTEPMTVCARPVRFVFIAALGSVPTCRICEKGWHRRRTVKRAKQMPDAQRGLFLSLRKVS
jgi:hypothetical protein